MTAEDEKAKLEGRVRRLEHEVELLRDKLNKLEALVRSMMQWYAR